MFLPRAEISVTIGNAGDGDVNQEVLEHLHSQSGASRDDLIQGEAKGQVDDGPTVNLQGVGLHYKLINAERLARTVAEAILQLLQDGMAGSHNG